MKIFLESVKKYRVLWIFSIIMLVLAVVSVDTSKTRQPLSYNQSLDEVVATVLGEEITLREFALYVAHQEAEVDAQAYVYNPENTNVYWGLHTNGQFIRAAARNAAVNMAVHDELFYQLSKELEISFSEEEYERLDNDVADFWSDLTDYGKEEKLGISKQDIYDAMYKIACAEKCQYIYAQMKGLKYEDYDFSSEEYQEFLRGYEYSVNEKVLKRIDFGNVTLEH